VSSVTAESVVDAYTKRFAVVGQPISHSRSPEIFAALSRVSGVPLSYERLELTPEAFDRAFADAREDFDGWNVTAPHKARALAAADTVTDEARLVGAANVITFRDGDAYAANTDVGAVISLLRSRKIDPAGQVVTVLGAGGAARATVVALVQMGVKRIVIANRTIERGSARRRGSDRTRGRRSGCLERGDQRHEQRRGGRRCRERRSARRLVRRSAI
jgi:shikimate dehydrogenase